MRGILIYDAEGARRNEWFIARLIESAKSLGHTLEFVMDNNLDNALTCATDFAIVRTINPEINKKLESLGIPTYNNSKTSRVANDKWQTYLLAKELGISVMETALATEDSKWALTYPKVLKTVDGHGGNEVFLVKNSDEYAEKAYEFGYDVSDDYWKELKEATKKA